MDTGQPDSLLFAVTFDVDISAATEGKLVLADLVALGKVRIEVILSFPAAIACDLAVRGKSCADGELHHLFVQDGQDPGKAHADRAGILVRGISKAGGAPTEDLGFGQELGMDLEADDGFITQGYFILS
jgi:hypothetical protein